MEKTLQNLCKAFIGESQARNRYTYYAKVAQKQGYEQIGAIFLETAEQEKIHAKRIFEHIQELKAKLGKKEEIIVEASCPITYENTAENLQAAIDGENHEHETMYPKFAKIADEENLPHIAKRLRSIAKAEKHHSERYQKLLKQLKENSIFKKENEVAWVCRECGYVHTGKEPPEICPSCSHPKAFYQIKCEEY